MKQKSNRKKIFQFFKIFLRLFKRRPTIINLGEEPLQDQSIYLTNHVGFHSPLMLELYFPKLFRFWGTHEMNDDFKSRFKYLSTTYFHEKKHFNKPLAFFISIFATPFMTVFYRGIRLISTYRDSRLLITIKESLKVIKDEQSIVIFPENSSDGYHDQLTEYFSGFYTLAHKCYKEGMDLLIYNMYYQKKKNRLIVDKPIRFSDLQKTGMDKYQAAEMFRVRANELGLYDIEPKNKEQLQETENKTFKA